MSVAFAIGDDGKALIQAHKTKSPRALEKILKDAAPDSKNHRFGSAVADAEDPKHVHFIVNKAGGGLARKLILALKGTGFSRVTIELEDGTAVEQHAEDDPSDIAAGVDTAGAPSGEDIDPPDGEAAQQSPSTPEPSDADRVGGLKIALASLVKQMMDVIAKDPSQKTALVQMAADAQASLKHDDAAQASAGIDLLREALSAASARDAGRPRLDPDKAMKAHHAWHGTRTLVNSQLVKLQAGIKKHYDGHPDLANIEAATTGSLGAILDELDTSLAEHFDRYANAAPEDQAEALADIRATVKRHQAFVAGNPLIQEIDDNPFVSIFVRKSLETTLSTLSRNIG